MPLSARLISTGSYLPEKVVKNEDLTQFPPGAIPLIEQKTGVRMRRHAGESECTSDLAIHASRACLQAAGFPAEEIDALILATSSPDRIQPATATRVQCAIGARRAFAFDVNSVCSGAVYAIHVGDALIRSGSCRTVLVVASEVYSRYLNPADFSTYPYFGDGAGAVLLSAGSDGTGVIHSLLRADGSGADVIQVPAGGTMLPYAKVVNRSDLYFKMRGKEVYSFAVEKGAEVIREVLDAAGLASESVRFVIPHQANLNIIHELSRRSGIALERFVVNLETCGNTAAASVLIALDQLMTSARSTPGDLLLLVAFGGGLSWGACLIKL